MLWLGLREAHTVPTCVAGHARQISVFDHCKKLHRDPRTSLHRNYLTENTNQPPQLWQRVQDPAVQMILRVSQHIRKHLRLKPVTADDELGRLLAEVVKILSAQAKIRGSVWHDAENVSIETSAPCNN